MTISLSLSLSSAGSKYYYKVNPNSISIIWRWGAEANINKNGFMFMMSFPNGSDGKEPFCNAGDLVSIPGLGRSPGAGNGNQFQYSCLKNSMDRGAWQATVHEVVKSQLWSWLNISHHSTEASLSHQIFGWNTWDSWRWDDSSPVTQLASVRVTFHVLAPKPTFSPFMLFRLSEAHVISWLAPWVAIEVGSFKAGKELFGIWVMRQTSSRVVGHHSRRMALSCRALTRRPTGIAYNVFSSGTSLLVIKCLEAFPSF